MSRTIKWITGMNEKVGPARSQSALTPKMESDAAKPSGRSEPFEKACLPRYVNPRIQGSFKT